MWPRTMEMTRFLSLLTFVNSHIESEGEVTLKQPSVGDLVPQINVQSNVIKKGAASGIKQGLMPGAPGQNVQWFTGLREGLAWGLGVG